MKRLVVYGKHLSRIYIFHSNPWTNKGVVLFVTSDKFVNDSSYVLLSNSSFKSFFFPIFVWYNRLRLLRMYKMKILCLFNKENDDFNESSDFYSKTRKHIIINLVFLTILDDYSRATW